MEGEEEGGGEELSGACECNAELMNHSNCLFYILILKVMGLDSGYTNIHASATTIHRRDLLRRQMCICTYILGRHFHITLNHFKLFQVLDESFLVIEL
jgi:hypothetical protein